MIPAIRSDESIFAEALEKATPAERADFLTAACGEDAGLQLAERVRGALDSLAVGGSVYCGPFRTGGAHVWRGDPVYTR